MNSIFDQTIDRRHTGSVKWDHAVNDETICMDWADMDFKCPQAVIDCMKETASFGIFGYAEPGQKWYEALTGFCQRHYGWGPKREWVSYTPGVISALCAAVCAYTKPGDKVIIQSPVFVRFRDVVESNGRKVSDNCLKRVGDHYEIDFDDLEQRAADPDTHLMILCSPHNPVCRVWTKEELLKVGEICKRNHVIVVDDEIHCDLVFNPNRHYTFASLGDDYAMNSIVCFSPSKTFNLAGLQTAVAVICNPALKAEFDKVLHSRDICRPTIFGMKAMEAAYNHGDQWLDELLEYIHGNIEFVTKTIHDKCPKLHVIPSEGTYMVWIDCKGLGMGPGEAAKFFLEKANVSLTGGIGCGTGGEYFVRMNLAYSRSVVEEALQRMLAAVAML